MTLAITFYDGIQYHRSDFLLRDSDFIGAGVVVASEFPFTIPATPNMSFTIGQGRAWVDGYRISNDASPVSLNVSAADPTNPRIDIVQIGHDDINSTFSLVVKKGVAAGSPVEPGADAGYVKLWAIAVAANATSIVAGNFTDRRALVPLNISGSQISFAGAAGTGQANAFSGNQTLNPLGTATSGANFGTYELGFTRSVWSGSIAQNKSSFFQVDNTGKLNFINEAAASVWSLDQSGNVTGRTFTSNVAVGTAPFTVTSTTLVPNLNAQLLNGNNSSFYAPIASPGFTGAPTVPTPAGNDNSTTIVNSSWVRGAITTYAPTPAGATTSVLGTVEIAATPASGSPIVPTVMSDAKEVLLTTTGITTTHTVTTVTAGNYLVLCSFRVITAATNVTIEIDWTDATGAQVNNILTLTSEAVGTHALIPLFINATAGTAINVKVTAGTANQVYVSSSILGV